MRKAFYPIAALLLVTGLTGPAFSAEESALEPASASTIDPYDDVYEALDEGVDQDLAIGHIADATMDALQHELPELALIESKYPGTLAGLRKNVLPVLSAYSTRVRLEYRPKMIDALRRVLTLEEAQGAAAFYRSELGKKLLAGVTQNYTLEDTVRSAASDPGADIKAGTLDGDLKRTGIQAYLSLTPREQDELNHLAIEKPELTRIGEDAGIRALRLEMENAPLSADEEQQLSLAIKSAFAALKDAKD